MSDTRKDRIDEAIKLGNGLSMLKAAVAWDTLIGELNAMTEPEATSPRFDHLLDAIGKAANRASAVNMELLKST